MRRGNGRIKYEEYVATEDLMLPQPVEALEIMEENRKAVKMLDRTLLLGIQDSIVKGA